MVTKEQMEKAYKETESKWNKADLKYKKKKIRKYLDDIEIKTDEQRQWVANQFLMIDTLDSPEIDELLNFLNSAIMANAREDIDNMK